MTTGQAVLYLLAVIALFVGAGVAVVMRAVTTALAFAGAGLALLAYVLPGLTAGL